MRANHSFFIVLLSLSLNYVNIFTSSTRVISTMEFNITEPSTSSSYVPEFPYPTLDMDDPKTARLFVKKCFPASCQYAALSGDTYLVIVVSAAMGKEFYTIMESIKKLDDRILLEEKADPQRAERMGLIIVSCRGEILMHIPLGMSNEQLRNLNYTIEDKHFQYHGTCDLTKAVDLIADNLMSHDHDYETPRDQIVEIYSTGVSANSNSWISIVELQQQLGVKVGISEPSDSDGLSPNAKYLSPLYHLMSTPNDINGNNLLKDMCINSCKCDYNLLNDDSSIGGCYRLSSAPSSVRFAKCNEDGSELAPIISVEDAIQLFDRAGLLLSNESVDRGFLLPFIYNVTLGLYIFKENETLDGFPPDMDTTNVNPLVKDGIPQEACLAIRPGRDPLKPQWFSIDCREAYNYFCVKPPVDEFTAK